VEAAAERAARYARAAHKLAVAKTVAVVGHLRPDADAIGSVTALTLGLEKIGKTVTPLVGQPDPFSRNLLSIPGADRVRPATDIPGEHDLVVAVDCGSVDRTGTLTGAVLAAAEEEKLLVIDHHVSNTGFGTINLIDTRESTTSMIRELLLMIGVPLDRDIAHCLYAGLMTDTGSFRWGTASMHTLAAELMSYGLDPRRIAADLVDSTSVADLQMVGNVLARTRMVEAGGFNAAVLVADQATIEGHSESAVESLADYVRELNGSNLGVVLKEQGPGWWAVSLRSSRCDVSQVAIRLGGGGHVAAAGYTSRGTAEEALAELATVLSTTDVSL
jgi:bifunctional oligoribonuclease and PAP phosphatase NrnA